MARRPVKAQRRNLSASIADELLARIRSGELPPGARLPTEKQFVEEYGVGRNTVREAIQSLVTMGYLDTRPGVGAHVLGVPTREAVEASTISPLLAAGAVGDIYELRLALEVAIAQRAAEVATAEDVRAITTALDNYARAVRDEHEPFRADVAFHDAVAQASHNVAFVNVLGAAGDLLLDARRLTDRLPGAVSLALEEHSEIADAVAAHDPDRARYAMEVHMATSVRAWERAHQLFLDNN